MATDGSQIPREAPAEAYLSDKGSDYVLPKRLLAFGPGVTHLSPFSDDYAFFTIAAAYLWGAFQDLVLWDFQNLRGRSVEFFHRKFHRPLFRGLELDNGNADWNHALWAIRREEWSPFVDHMCSVVLTDTPGKFVYRFALQEFEIVDPLTADQGLLTPAMPTLAIAAFGVRSNQYVAAFDVGENPLTDLPQLRFYRPDERCKLYAQALFTTDPQVALSVVDDQTVKENLSARTSQLPTGDGSQPGIRG